MSGLAPGQAHYEKRLRCLLVGTSDGTVQLFKLKAAGGKVVTAEAFWNGLKNRSHVVFQGGEL